IGESLTPVAAGSLTGVTSLDAGRAHTCAALADGHVWCWGQQAEGRLGNALPTTAAVQAPVQALLPGDMEFTDAVQVVTGEAHTCVRHETGSVSCFGDNSVGQLGTGTEGSPQAYAQAVSGLSDVTQLAAGAFHTCALTDEGIYC